MRRSGLRQENLTSRIVKRLMAAIRKSNYELDKVLAEFEGENMLEV